MDAEAPARRSVLTTLLVSFGPTLLFVFLFFFILRRLGGGAGGFSGLGRSKAKRYEPTTQRTTFADVAGIEEAEEQLVEIVDFLKSPEKYRRLGGAIPRGVLLSGLPGTGKTLLARAMAGEAGVPFFSLSASEFVEMVVGVGASRVRDLFEQAKAEAPAIIFIDELDAVGRARGGSNQFAGHDEREQTLNQILTEMDGFSGPRGRDRDRLHEPAGDPRPRSPAAGAVRPPRRRQPARPARPRAILGVHTRDVPLADDVDLDALASTTPGMVGADLRNVINEAALLAARRDRESVTSEDIAERAGKGDPRRRAEADALAGRQAPHRLPRGRPRADRDDHPRRRSGAQDLDRPARARARHHAADPRGRPVRLLVRVPARPHRPALGGRAAEELVYGEYTTGAEADLEYVTSLARRMVGRWGMSSAIGPISVLPGVGDEGATPQALSLLAGETRELFDAEVRRFVDEGYARALGLLRTHRDKLDALVAALLEQETLEEAESYRIAGIERPTVSGNGVRPGAARGRGRGAARDRRNRAGRGRVPKVGLEPTRALPEGNRILSPAHLVVGEPHGSPTSPSFAACAQED